MYIRIAKKIVKRKLDIIEKPSFVTFFATWRCNCKCIMCDIWKKKDADEMTVAEIGEIFSQLRLDAVRISGGEPFLRNDLAEIINIIDQKSKPGVIHVTTNGLLTKQILSVVKKVKPIKKLHIKVSIDNVAKEHDRIRGVPAFDKAMTTVKELAKLKKGFFLGVNQTIVDNDGLRIYPKLRDMLAKYDVDLLPVIAYDASTSLYSDTDEGSDSSFKNFGKFNKTDLKKFLKQLKKDTEKVGDIKEKLLKKYQLLSMENWLLRNRNDPNPKCVALHNHLRILPNGDVPVCMYNKAVVGNLRRSSLKNIWFGDKIQEHRDWVRSCPGCRAGCEVNVSAIYTGDIMRGLF